MKCDRALAILQGLFARQLAATGDEIDELIKLGLVVESDALALGHLRDVELLVAEFREFFQGVATQREAMLSAEQAALGLNVERRQERAGLAPRR